MCDEEPVRRAFVHLEDATRDERRSPASVEVDLSVHIFVAMHDKSRHLDLRELCAEVGVGKAVVAVENGFERSMDQHAHTPLHHGIGSFGCKDWAQVVSDPLGIVGAPQSPQVVERTAIDSVGIVRRFKNLGECGCDQHQAGHAAGAIKSEITYRFSTRHGVCHEGYTAKIQLI